MLYYYSYDIIIHMHTKNLLEPNPLNTHTYTLLDLPAALVGKPISIINHRHTHSNYVYRTIYV